MFYNIGAYNTYYYICQGNMKNVTLMDKNTCGGNT